MSDRLTAAEYLERVNGKGKKGEPPDSPKASKMRNQPTPYNGRTYQSKKEATRAKELDWMVHLGEIQAWEAQVPFKLEINSILITTYVLDFLITHKDGSKSYEDCKGQRSGVPYQLFKLKKHLMKALHGIEVKEV